MDTGLAKPLPRGCCRGSPCALPSANARDPQALKGTNGIIDQACYTILVTVVVLSAVVPTLIATTFFQPIALTKTGREEVEATEGIDAGSPRREPGIRDEGEPA